MDDKPFASQPVVDMMQMLIHFRREDRADGSKTQDSGISIKPQGGVFAKCYSTSIPFSFAM